MSSASFDLGDISQLAEAGLDLRHYGELWMLAEESALQRAANDRAPYPAEQRLEDRLNSSRGHQLSAVETVRAAASDFPRAFNETLAVALSDERVDPNARVAFEDGIGVIGGDYASVVLTVCDRISAVLRDRAPFAGSMDTDFPPVSGGESLACDLIVVAGMAGGATCVMGCGPCCAGGVAAVLGYAAFC